MASSKRNKNSFLGDLFGKRVTYHAKIVRGSSRPSKTEVEYKGVKIRGNFDEGFKLSKIDRETSFDTVNDAKRFVDYQMRHMRNPKYPGIVEHSHSLNSKADLEYYIHKHLVGNSKVDQSSIKMDSGRKGFYTVRWRELRQGNPSIPVKAVKVTKRHMRNSGVSPQFRKELNRIGITITYNRDYAEYRVNFRGGSERTAYYTDSLSDAYETGKRMAESKLRKGNPSIPKNKWLKVKAVKVTKTGVQVVV